MGLNILSELDGLINQRQQYKAAVLMTYSLSLQFFEQLVQPRLDSLGCANVLIIADQFGYEDALQRNLHRLRAAGRQYVCAAVPPKGRGVQHAKALMLVSEARAWMLLGSGNLTFHGYGQNLELFDRFLVEGELPASQMREQQSPFQETWGLVEALSDHLGVTAQEMIDRIHDSVPWLANPPRAVDGAEIWSSLETPLLDRLALLEPVDELQLIAPFFDTQTVARLLEHFLPRKLVLGVGAAETSLDGEEVDALCLRIGCEPEMRAIRTSEPSGVRPLHAKAIVGIGDDSSWCVSGSANITRPAVMDTWASAGNLEVVTYRSAVVPDAFNTIWTSDAIAVQPVMLSEARAPRHDFLPAAQLGGLRLTELVERHGDLEGTFVCDEPAEIAALWIELLQGGQELPITPDRQGHFRVRLAEALPHAEAGRLYAQLKSGSSVVSAPLLVDRPHELLQYATRSYRQSIRARLDSVQEAAHTFKDLMDFLFARVDREAVQKDLDRTPRGIRKRGSRQEPTPRDDDHEVLPAAAFITDEELTVRLGQRLDTLDPYDRNHYSLRDLLSLVLLRLTTETSPERLLDASVDSEEDERATAEAIEREAAQRKTWQEWLKDYVVQYCRRYGERLNDPQFVAETGADLILQNQFTLGRVLLEFYGKVALFREKQLRESVRQIWGFMFGESGVLMCLADETGEENLRAKWHAEGLSELFVVMVATAWPGPFPRWSDRKWPARLQPFMYARHLIEQAESWLGAGFWRQIEWSEIDHVDLTGFRTLTDLESPGEGRFEERVAHFERLANFATPIEERYAPLFRWHELREAGEEQSEEARQLEGELRQQDPQLFRKVQQAQRIRPIIGNSHECPVTHIQLPDILVTRLKNGELVASAHAPDALLYWLPEFSPDTAIL